jgi:hypothetical protein
VPSAPTATRNDLGSEARLAVQAMEHRLRIRNDRLDLDHQDGPGPRVHGQDVDGSPLTPGRERDLDLHGPAARAKTTDDGLDKGSVILIKQAIQLLAVISEAQVDVRSERRRCPDECTDGHAAELAPIDRADQRPRQTRRGCHVGLAAPKADPEGAELATEAERIHVRIIAVVA